MNLIAVIILLALLVDYFLDLAADVLNLRALRSDVPAPLAGIYNPDDYRKSQEYTRVNTRFGIMSSTFSLVVMLAFWFSGGFSFLDQVVRSWGFPPIVNGLLYTGILGLAYGLLTLPFSIYHTFVIEQRFGFNRTTPRVFVVDMLKGLALGVLIGAPLLAGILALFEYAGSYAWLFGWGIVTVVSLAISYIAPTWIMPLFNKFTPLESGELRDSILGYARSVDFSLKNVYVMDGSKRSTRSNAFFTGFGKNKRIALFDTLIARHTVPELVGVLAHEIGHYKKKHIIQGTIISILHTGVLFFLLSLILGSPALYQAFYIQQPSIYTGLIFFGLLYTPVEMVLSIIMQAVSRRNEYQADRFAAITTHDKESMLNALRKLYKDNLSNLTPHPFYVFLNYSHPPLLQRIEAVRRAEAKATENSAK